MMAAYADGYGGTRERNTPVYPYRVLRSAAGNTRKYTRYFRLYAAEKIVPLWFLNLLRASVLRECRFEETGRNDRMLFRADTTRNVRQYCGRLKSCSGTWTIST